MHLPLKINLFYIYEGCFGKNLPYFRVRVLKLLDTVTSLKKKTPSKINISFCHLNYFIIRDSSNQI